MPYIMNTAGTLAHALGSVITGGVFVITGTAHIDPHISINSLSVCRQTLAFTFTGGSSPGFVDGTVSGGGTINGTSTRVFSNGLSVILEGDTGTLSATGTLSGGGQGAVSGLVEVNSAGQVLVNGV